MIREIYYDVEIDRALILELNNALMIIDKWIRDIATNP